MEPGVHEEDMDEVELFLRWVERRDGRGKMTEERLKAAQGLWERIAILHDRMAQVARETWRYGIPEEMRQRHRREIQAWLDYELRALQAEVAAL